MKNLDEQIDALELTLAELKDWMRKSGFDVDKILSENVGDGKVQVLPISRDQQNSDVQHRQMLLHVWHQFRNLKQIRVDSVAPRSRLFESRG